MASLTLLTGPRGAGKTSLCLHKAEKARADGQTVAGLLSPARFERNYKVGIDALDLRSGQRRPLAQRRSKATGGAPFDLSASLKAGFAHLRQLETSNWRFDPDALAWGAEVLRQATPCDLLIIDELGPLEFERRGGWLVALDIITQGDYRHALVVVRPELLEVAQNRWPWAEIWQVGG
ncbi:MAG TPA: hypothetical protein G4N96_00215 [Chloroflexi bacterium]|nr:hypothetical protein [Chloroflexota bacterium]